MTSSTRLPSFPTGALRLSALLVFGCSRAAPPAPAAAPARAQLAALRTEAPQVLVPRTRDTVDLDGALSEPAWRTAARTGAFVEPGTREAARPHSDARLLWDGTRLLVAL